MKTLWSVKSASHKMTNNTIPLDWLSPGPAGPSVFIDSVIFDLLIYISMIFKTLITTRMGGAMFSYPTLRIMMGLQK